MYPWAAYAFFAFVAIVVIVLLLHEVLDDDAPMEIGREEPAAAAPPVAASAGNRYAAKHVRENEAPVRRVA